ncbi:MAG TPA: prolyl oligopeptidase family serine peptidase, partial [Candidatus Nitrosotenuis sp.]|nr:prolyl oligopeptidase family serine peptidase [Candidatus Nitrosotenuis sp.]
MKLHLRRTFIALAALFSVAILAAAPAAAQAGPEGRWNGSLSAMGQSLPFSVEFKRAGDSWQGVVDIQGMTNLPLSNVTYKAPDLHFELASPAGTATFDGKLEGNKITGTMQQGPLNVPFVLERKAAPAEEQQKLPEGMIPREVLFGNPEKAAPQISPDGKKLAYLAPNSDGVLNVWVRTLGQTDDAVVTNDKKRGIRNYAWQYDSEHIIYIQDKDGDENWNIYQTNLKNKRTRNLTPYDGIQAQLVAADPKFPDTLLVGLNLDDPRLHDVYRLNLKTGALELDTKNPGDVAGFTADNNLVVRAAQIFTPDGGNEFRVRADAKSPWKTFHKWDRNESLGGIYGFTPDNKSVWMASSVGANTLRLLEMDIATAKSKTIVEDKTYDVGGPMVNPKTNKLEAVSIVRERTEWEVIDPAVKADFEALRKVRDGDFSVASRTLDDTKWIVVYDLDNAPVSYYLYDRAAKKAEFLFTNRPRLEKFKLANMKPISFKSRDGLTVHAYLTLPNVSNPKNLPLILNVHGGPWGRDVWGLDNEAQWMANRGYAVLQINFRGSTGYGKAFLNAGDREWAGKMHED